MRTELNNELGVSEHGVLHALREMVDEKSVRRIADTVARDSGSVEPALLGKQLLGPLTSGDYDRSLFEAAPSYHALVAMADAGHTCEAPQRLYSAVLQVHARTVGYHWQSGTDDALACLFGVVSESACEAKARVAVLQFLGWCVQEAQQPLLLTCAEVTYFVLLLDLVRVSGVSVRNELARGSSLRHRNELLGTVKLNAGQRLATSQREVRAVLKVILEAD